MNKINFTNDRLFTSFVRSGRSLKKRLIFSILSLETIFRKFGKTYFFCEEYQPLFDEIPMKLENEFVPYLDFGNFETS